jgi:6-phospho-3-hexuloisomerase
MKVILNDMNDMAGNINEDEINIYVDALTDIILKQGKENINFIGLGAGRMGYALRAFIMRLSHMGYNACMIGDTSVPRVTKNTVLFINSSSGETPSIALYVEQAKVENGITFSTTCNPTSRIGINSDYLITLPLIDSSQLMKSPYEQFSMLLYDYIVIKLMKSLALDSKEVSNNHSILE